MMELDFDSITPLRLATGSHTRGSGRGCAMNLLSFMRGDVEITDFPECSAPALARLVQSTNDRLGGDRGTPIGPERKDMGDGVSIINPGGWYLTPEDSFTVLDLAWSTVGTAGMHESGEALWAGRLIEMAGAILRAAGPMDDILQGTPLARGDEAWSALARAQVEAKNGTITVFSSQIAGAVHLAAGVDAVVEFARAGIAAWKEIGGFGDAPAADPVRVVSAYEEMVSL